MVINYIKEFLSRHPDLYTIARCFRNLSIVKKIRIDSCKKEILKQYPNIKSEIKVNESLKNKYFGERCFILGNGPSLNSIDFSLLANEFVFTVNQIAKNPNFSKLKTNFHIWSDPRFFDISQTKPEDQELLNTMLSVKTNDNEPIIFYPHHALPMIEKLSLKKQLNINIYLSCNFLNIKDYLTKTIDFSDFKPDFPTVVHQAITLAVFMGFKKIILLGCDCTGFINTAYAKLNKSENSEYAYTISENEKKRMEKISNIETMRAELASNVNLFDTYENLYIYCQNHNVELLNASNPTLLECIPKVNYKELFKNKITY